ncbi:MAG: succinate dehydrogenase, cytochrome b556 subunit [Burkholderiaceae bacterium]
MSRHTERGYFAFVAHRVSGLALAAFLPFHFLLLGSALRGEQALDGLLHWADTPLVKIAEWGLVALLTLHLVFGLRLLMIEFGPVKAPADLRLRWVIPGTILAFVVGTSFVLIGTLN